MTTWAEHLTKTLGKKATVELMNIGNQNAQDHYSCGVWVLLATKTWIHFQETCPGGHWPTHFNEAVSKWGTTNRTAIDAYRKSIQEPVKAQITAADGQRQTPVDDQQREKTQQGTGDPTTHPKVEGRAPQTRAAEHKSCTKQPGLWKWLHRLAPTVPTDDSRGVREEQQELEPCSDEEAENNPPAQWEKFDDMPGEVAHATIDRAGETVLDIPTRANKCALKDEEMPTAMVGGTSNRVATDLLMSKKDMKTRDAAILKMRAHKKTKQQLRNPHTEHSTLQNLKAGEREGPADGNDADAKEWLKWLTDEAKKERQGYSKAVHIHPQQQQSAGPHQNPK
ncbi:hypothetical protein CYMTET_23265 [Cymbomonas tetramitiformis]|uniref:Uncharacterized protein n=1 Tax=Cymbomonas tetramitiformis TaxID=36881 RepID=A0AAE0L145_9CHLO|nr:hypothetical protein CYMTET_23265 [Cymbomonas tetramitiformis]